MNLSTELISLILEYGYFFVFLGGWFEGESVLILSGLLAQQDNLSLGYIMLFALLGALISDYIWFFAGRYFGDKIIQKFNFFKKISSRLLSTVNNHTHKLSFGLRFLYGFRSMVPFSLGLSKIKTIHFLFLNFLGGILWVTVFSFLGYLLGNVTENIFGQVKKYNIAILIFILLIFVFLSLAKKMIKYLIKRKFSDGDDGGGVNV